jgi:hypothetical protein
VAEDETKFGQVSAVVRVFIEHLILAIFEQFHSLLALPDQVANEHIEMLIVVQNLKQTF